MTKNTLTSNLIQYNSVFKKHGVDISEHGNHLYHRFFKKKPQWTLHLSTRSVDTLNLLNLILPKVKASKVPFRIIKNQFLQYQLNAGIFGVDEIGKVISLYPETAASALSLADELNCASASFKGPIITSALRIGEVLYTETHKGSLDIDFPIQKQYLISKKRPARLGKFYVPLQIVKTSYKGNIYKAVSLKNLSFKTCLIKEGKPVALDDQFEREMKDRLLWQKTVLLDLSSSVLTPAYLDYFEDKDHSYLVMQHIEGVTLFQLVQEIYTRKNWNELSAVNKQKLLQLFIDALSIIISIHNKGYVQRDISDSNFMVMKNGKLCIIDFELSYNMVKKEPEHPFLLGTHGYMAPEQREYVNPDYTADIYSLGALLCFILTGTPPVNFLNPSLDHVLNKLNAITNDIGIANLIIHCLSPRRSDRPDLITIKQEVEEFIQSII